jgi:hypothetical protein
VTESALQHRILVAYNRGPVRLWRNNVGIAHYPDGSVVRYGLAPGSADLIGLIAGRFLAVECKSPRGRLRREQKEWLAVVERLGGIAVVAREVEDVARAIEAASGPAGGGTQARGG